MSFAGCGWIDHECHDIISFHVCVSCKGIVDARATSSVHRLLASDPPNPCIFFLIFPDENQCNHRMKYSFKSNKFDVHVPATNMALTYYVIDASE